MTRLIVESVHRMTSRPWLFVTGHLEGDALRIGDELAVADSDSATTLVVRSVEIHGAPGVTTIAVDGSSPIAVERGTVLIRG